MTPKKKPRASLLFALLLAGILLFLAFRGANWHEILTTLRRGHLPYLALGFLLLSVGLSLRALRWRVLLQAEQPIGPLPVFWAMCAGYLGNNLLPARAGEIIRAVLIARRTAMSASYVLATELCERITDAVALAVIAGAAPLALKRMPSWLPNSARIVALLGVLALLGLFIASRYGPALSKVLSRMPLSAKRHAQLSGLLQGFLLGLRALQQPRRALLFLAFTALIWLVDTATVITMARALDLVLTVPQALLLLAALGLASAAPSAPGYVGIYQFVAVTVLMPFGYTRDQALVLIIAFQVVIYIAVLLWGTLGLWQSSGIPFGARRLWSKRIDLGRRGQLGLDAGEPAQP